MDKKITNRRLTELREYADMEGSKIGAYWDTLATLYLYANCMPKDLKVAVEKGINDALNEAHNAFEIVEEKVTSTRIERYLKEKTD